MDVGVEYDGNHDTNPSTMRSSRTCSMKAPMSSMLGSDSPLASTLRLADDRMVVCHPGYLNAHILATSSLTIPRTQEVAMAMDPATRRRWQGRGRCAGNRRHLKSKPSILYKTRLKRLPFRRTGAMVELMEPNIPDGYVRLLLRRTLGRMVTYRQLFEGGDYGVREAGAVGR